MAMANNCMNRIGNKRRCLPVMLALEAFDR